MLAVQVQESNVFLGEKTDGWVGGGHPVGPVHSKRLGQISSAVL